MPVAIWLVGWLLHSLSTCIGRSSMRHATGFMPFDTCHTCPFMVPCLRAFYAFITLHVPCCRATCCSPCCKPSRRECCLQHGTVRHQWTQWISLLAGSCGVELMGVLGWLVRCCHHMRMFHFYHFGGMWHAYIPPPF